MASQDILSIPCEDHFTKFTLQVKGAKVHVSVSWVSLRLQAHVSGHGVHVVRYPGPNLSGALTRACFCSRHEVPGEGPPLASCPGMVCGCVHAHVRQPCAHVWLGGREEIDIGPFPGSMILLPPLGLRIPSGLLLHYPLPQGWPQVCKRCIRLTPTTPCSPHPPS